MHHEPLIHVTAWNRPLVAPAGIGAGTIDHVEPFHCAASSEECAYPTAMHQVEVVQEIPRRSVNVDPVGAGLEMMLHAEPFHSSAKLAPAPLPIPTATQ